MGKTAMLYAPLDTFADDIRPVSPARRRRGRRSYLSGAAAEDGVLDRYCRVGYRLRERRWRGKAGEIDLILEQDGVLVFVEVKKGPDFETAATRLRPQQIARICAAADEYAGAQPDGALSEMRFDLGLVDARGAIDIVENALAF